MSADRVKIMFGQVGEDATKVNLTSFQTSQIASSPSTGANNAGIPLESRALFEAEATPTTVNTNDTIGNVFNGISAVVETEKKKQIDNSTIKDIKSVAEGIIDDPSLLNDLDDDFWSNMVNDGINVDRLKDVKGLNGIINAMTGTDCAAEDLDDFKNSFLDNLLDKGLGLGLEDFFDCLLEELKGMGAGFVNSVVKNSQTILEDGTMTSLKGVGDVLEEESSTWLPNYSDSLQSFTGTSDSTADMAKIDSTLKLYDNDWQQRQDGSVDLDRFYSASPAAKQAFAQSDDEAVMTGNALCGLFENEERNAYTPNTSAGIRI